MADAGTPDRTVLVADEQRSGRGRLGRRWHSPPGRGLYLSVLFRDVDGGPLVTRWTLAGAVAACRACRTLSGAEIAIKWPNDLVHAGRKLGGVLAELRGGSELILGTGINVSVGHTDLPPELAPRVTSLVLASGRMMLDREQLAAAYLRELGRVVDRLRGGRWEDVARDWIELTPGARCRRVRVRGPHELEGTTAGIDEAGALLVRLDDGTIRAVQTVESVTPVEE